jgi:mannan endo-1,4-beta-mannosidase
VSRRARIESLERRLFLSVARPASNTGTGFFVSDGKVYDANGNEFVMKGVNAVHAWGSYNTNYNTIDQVAKTGANAVRAVMYQDIVADATNNWNDSADTPARRKTVAERYIANAIAVIAEDHASIQDSASQSSKVALDEITQHWINNQSWLKQYEKYVIVNIANEWGQPAHNADTDHSWRDAYIDEVNKLRKGADNTLGTADDITNMIMIDAGQWGQDYNTLKYDAQAVEDADPQHNVLFSIHLYGQWRDDSRAFEESPTNDFGPWDINTGLTQLKSANLPLLVGEFAFENFRDFNSGGPFASYRTTKLLQTLNTLDVGWMGWSYNGSSPQSLNFLTNLNNTTYNSNTDLSDWGNVLVNDPTYGLKASAQRASVFYDPLPAIPNPGGGLPALPSAMLGDNWFVLDRTTVGVPEGGQGIAQVRLSRQPASNVIVNLNKLGGGDIDVNLNTSSLLFTPANWNQYQPILLTASADADTNVGLAKFQLSASGMTSTDVIAKEIEAPAAATGNTYLMNPIADRLYNGSGAVTPVTVGTIADTTFYMRFPLSSLRGKITDAHLRVFTTNTTANRRVRVYAVLDDGWTEVAGNTASNSNPINAAYPLYPGTDNSGFLLPTVAGGSFLDIGITELVNFVRSEYLKDGVVTLALRMVSGTASFATNQHPSNPPQLAVTTSEAVPPQLLASSFDYQTSPNGLTFTFNEDVSASLSSADVQVASLTNPGATISLGTPTYNAATNTASFALTPGILPDGNYRATLSGAGITDAASNSMLSDTTLDFFSLAGDANHDRTVDVTDLGILATNWQATGMTFAQGDFNRDGNVDVTDLGILATNWQKAVPALGLSNGLAASLSNVAVLGPSNAPSPATVAMQSFASAPSATARRQPTASLALDLLA